MGTNTGQVMTLANSIIGVSILAMPYCFKQCGILLSILLLCLSSILSRFACHFLLKAAIITRRRNYEFLAFHVFGSSGKLGVELAIIGFLLGTCIAFFVVMGDLGPAIISSTFGLHKTDTLRTTILVGMAFLVVLPLGLLRNVDSLSSLCAATVAFYLCLVLKVIGEAMASLVSGEWLSQVNFWRPEGLLQCTPIFSMALFCQTQLFEIFDSVPNAALDKLNAVIRVAINMCTAVYISVGFFGYVAFSKENITGNILVSLSQTMSSEVIKLGFVLSLAMSFPLVIFPCRASLYSLLYRNSQPPVHDISASHVPEGRFKLLTLGIVGISLVVGLLLPNIERVLGIVGSTIGVTICIITPALLLGNTARHPKDRLISQIIMWSGAVIMILGTYAHILNSEQSTNVDPVLEQDSHHILDHAIDQFIEHEAVVVQSVQREDDLKKFVEVSDKREVQHSGKFGGRVKNKIQPPEKPKYFKPSSEKNSDVHPFPNNLDKESLKLGALPDKELKPGKNNNQMPEPPVPADIGDKQQEPPVPIEAVVKQASPEPVAVMAAPISRVENVPQESKSPKRKMKIKEQLIAQRNRTNIALNAEQVNQDAIHHEDAESALEAKEMLDKNSAAEKSVQLQKEQDDEKKRAEEQKLIETLKEHQEVQRDMLNEQQRILQELKKHEKVQHEPVNEFLKDTPRKQELSLSPVLQSNKGDTNVVAESKVEKESNNEDILFPDKKSTKKKGLQPLKIPNNFVAGDLQQQPPIIVNPAQSAVKESKFGNAGPVIPLPLAYSVKVSSSQPQSLPSSNVDSKPAARDILESVGHPLDREKRNVKVISSFEIDDSAGLNINDGMVSRQRVDEVTFEKRNSGRECKSIDGDSPIHRIEHVDGPGPEVNALLKEKSDNVLALEVAKNDNFDAKSGAGVQMNSGLVKNAEKKYAKALILELKTPFSISEPNVDVHSDLQRTVEKFQENGPQLHSYSQIKSAPKNEGQ